MLGFFWAVLLNVNLALVLRVNGGRWVARCWTASIMGLAVVQLLGVESLSPWTQGLLMALLMWLSFAVAAGFWRVFTATFIIVQLLMVAGLLGPPCSFFLDEHVVGSSDNNNEVLRSLALKAQAEHYWDIKYCVAELKQIKGFLEKEAGYAASINRTLEKLEKEKTASLENGSLKQELEAEKLKGNLQRVI